MAGEPTLSDAIGLQAKPNWGLAMYALKRQDALDAAKAKAAKDQKTKDEQSDKDFNSLIKSTELDLDKRLYATPYVEASHAAMNKAFNDAIDLHRADNSNLIAVQNRINDLMGELNFNQNQTKAINDYKELVKQGKAHGDPDLLNMIEAGDYGQVYKDPTTGRMTSKGMDELVKQTQKNPQYRVNFNSNGSFAADPVPIWNANKDVEDLDKPENYNYLQSQKVPIKGTTQINNIDVLGMAPEVRTRAAFNILNDPQKLASIRIQWGPEMLKDFEATKKGEKPSFAPVEADPNDPSKPSAKSELEWYNGKLVNNILYREKAVHNGSFDSYHAPREGDKDKRQEAIPNGDGEIVGTIDTVDPQTGTPRVKDYSLYKSGKDTGRKYFYNENDKKYWELDENGKVKKGQTPVSKLDGDAVPNNVSNEYKINSSKDGYTWTTPVNTILATPSTYNLDNSKVESNVAGTEFKANQVVKLPYAKSSKGEIQPIISKNTTSGKAGETWFVVGKDKSGTPHLIPMTKAVYNNLTGKGGVNLNIPEDQLYSEGQSKTQTFKVGGKTYNIPAADVAEFKKEMNIK